MIAGAYENVLEVEKGRFLFAVNFLASGLSCRCIERRLSYKDKVIFRSVYVHANCAVSTLVVFPEYVCYTYLRWLGHQRFEHTMCALVMC